MIAERRWCTTGLLLVDGPLGPRQLIGQIAEAKARGVVPDPTRILQSSRRCLVEPPAPWTSQEQSPGGLAAANLLDVPVVHVVVGGAVVAAARTFTETTPELHSPRLPR